jgi:ribulose-phosphate 3-epimerase
MHLNAKTVYLPPYQILPTILEQTPDACREKIRIAETASKWIQWDIMDGKFVPNTTWHDPAVVKNWSIHAKIELDLMVEDPATMIGRWQNIHAFRRAVWHIEADIDHSSLIYQVKDQGREVGLAISPGTSLMDLTPYLEFLDVVQVMGVQPGKSGQALLPATVDTVRALHKMAPELTISVDGGVNDKTILPLAKAGASHFCMNSAFYTHAFPRDFLYGQLDRLEHLKLQ